MVLPILFGPFSGSRTVRAATHFQGSLFLESLRSGQARLASDPGGIVREESQFRIVVWVIDDIAAFCTESISMCPFSLRQGDDRDSPNIGLAGTLEVDLVDQHLGGVASPARTYLSVKFPNLRENAGNIKTSIRECFPKN